MKEDMEAHSYSRKKPLFERLRLRLMVVLVTLVAIYLPVLGGIITPMIWLLLLISPVLHNLLYWWWNPLRIIFPEGWDFLSGYVQIGRWLESPLYAAAPFVVAFGAVIFITGLAQIIMARVYKKGLVTSGLYGLVRHPQHLGIAIAAFGLLIWNEIGLRVGDIIAWTLIVFINILLAESEEEKILLEYGNDYLKYKKRVPFLLSFLPSMYGRLPKMLPSRGWMRKFVMMGLYVVFSTILIIALASIRTVHIR